MPPNCKKVISECFFLVTLKGAVGPNQMRIQLDAFNPIESPDQSVATPHPTDEQRPSNSLSEFMMPARIAPTTVIVRSTNGI